MNKIRHTTLAALTVLAAAALAACSSAPANNAMLDQARSAYGSAQANSQTQALAPMELRQAGEALGRADAAFAARESTEQVNQLSYLATQRVGLAQQTAARKSSEAAVAAAGAERDQLRLAARTREADVATQRAAVATQSATAATQTAAIATRDARSSQQQAEASQRESAAAQQQAASSQQQAATSLQQADAAKQQAFDAQQLAMASQAQAGEAERRNQALEVQMRELNAKKTDRGMVITIGDLLFDTDKSQLKSGGVQNIERLSGFLKQYPQRKAAIEGYTDSTGSEDHNMALSARRAEAVMAALLGMGVGRGQLAAQGYGESHPVAGNDSSGGRQMNRRVDIVLSDENGALAPR
jgi:outer membrane protein OmpA-like peptidoglycan-associated protein